MDPSTMDKMKREFIRSLQVTPEQIQQIMQVEQRTDAWFEARKNRLTGSVYGAAAGHNKYMSPRKLLMELLWSSFKGNKATQHGTKYEPVAAKAYETFITQHEKKKCVFYYPGLVVSPDHPWIAGSPDGLPLLGMMHILLEIKCPFYRSSYPFIPHYYYDQIQGIMGILRLPYCDFFTWSLECIQIRRFAFDRSYWERVLFPRLRSFYMDEYLPRIILKREGLLRPGELEPVIQISYYEPTMPCPLIEDEQRPQKKARIALDDP